MQILNSLKQISSSEKIGVLVGNFDGVHLGHQFLIQRFRDKCTELDLKSCILTFVPHPYFIFNPTAKSYLVSSYEEKRAYLTQQKLDYCIELTFDRDFSTMTPDQFLLKNIFVHNGLEAVFAGYDFGFGASKSGNYLLIKKYCDERGIYSEQGERYELSGAPVSSTIIRNHLRQGEIQDVNNKLGRPYQVSGRVIKGAGRGKLIGFPTANLDFDLQKIIPCTGVYITKIEIGGMLYQSITNVGKNPTFNSGETIHVETHVFSFNREIYGEVVVLTFLEKIRSEIKFKDVNELVAQIEKDCVVAKKYHQC
jgi:riboflavin kinase / FMN adenylyltransferase